jgi:peptidoglycan hydrolase-like protein with peptidoglycan-binding domain
MDMQAALQNVGFKTPKPKTTFIKDQLKTIVDRVFEHTIKARAIQMQRVGCTYKARYEGRETFVFGKSTTEAVSRLQYWDEVEQ